MVTQDKSRGTVAPLKAILYRYLAVSRVTIILVISTVIVMSAAAVFAPYIFSRYIDILAEKDNIKPAVIGFLFYAALMGVGLALHQIVQYLSLISSETLGYIAGEAFFDRLLKKTIDFFINNNAAEVQSAQMRGAQALTILSQLILVVFIPGLTQIIFAIIIMGAVIDPEIMIFVVIYGIFFVGLTFFMNRNTRKYLEAAASAAQAHAKFVGNAVLGMEALRYFGVTKWMSERFAQSARSVLETWKKFSVIRMKFAILFGLGLTIQFSATFLFLVPRLSGGTITIGDIVLFNMLLLQLNQPFEMIGTAIDDMVRARAQFRPYAQMWAAPEETIGRIRLQPSKSKGVLEFKDVEFFYAEGGGVSNVSFVAKRGCVTFIVGESGAGKSTVLKLALKTLEPQKGEVLLDEVDLHQVERDDWYGTIGVVPQDSLLLNDTLHANIVLGRPYEEVRLHSAARKAAIYDRIKSMPMGFNTVVGERGLKLSGGEQQRIAIARALYMEPKFLFLDEVSSALDEATEKAIMDHIRRVAGEVTVIAVTHRRQLINASDNVVVLPGPGITLTPK